jgi:hypothetical protein
LIGATAACARRAQRAELLEQRGQRAGLAEHGDAQVFQRCGRRRGRDVGQRRCGELFDVAHALFLPPSAYRANAMREGPTSRQRWIPR